MNYNRKNLTDSYLWFGSLSSDADKGGNPIDSIESAPNGTNNGFKWSICICLLNLISFNKIMIMKI